MLVPSGTGQAGLASLEPFQTEFPPLAFQVPVQVGWMDVVGREFLHRRRLGGYVKSEDVRFVPNGDRFNEGSGRKIAVPDGSHARSFDGGAGRAGDSEIEEPVLGWGKFGKGDHVGPDFLGRSVYDYFRPDGEERGFGKGFLFKAHQEESHGQDGERWVVAEGPILNQVAHPASHGSQGQGNGSGHEKAEDSLDGQSKQQDEGKSEGQQGDAQAGPYASSFVMPVGNRRGEAHGEGQANEKAPSVILSDLSQ